MVVTVTPLLVDQDPFNYGSINSREFGAGDESMLGEQFKDVL